MRARFALVTVLVLEASAVGLTATCVPAVAVDRHDPVGWLRRTDPATATLAVGRLLVLGVAAWLLLTTVLALGAAVLAALPRTPGPVRRAAAGAARGAPLGVRRLAMAAVGVGVLVAAVAPARAAPGSARPLIAPLGPVRAGRATAPPPPPGAGLPPSPAADPSIPVTDAGATHRVVAGEHLWGIAEATVAAHGGAIGPDAVDRYWRALCEANRARLASGDPDVITPGEELVLPPVA